MIPVISICDMPSCYSIHAALCRHSCFSLQHCQHLQGGNLFHRYEGDLQLLIEEVSHLDAGQILPSGDGWSLLFVAEWVPPAAVGKHLRGGDRHLQQEGVLHPLPSGGKGRLQG